MNGENESESENECKHRSALWTRDCRMMVTRHWSCSIGRYDNAVGCGKACKWFEEKEVTE